MKLIICVIALAAVVCLVEGHVGVKVDKDGKVSGSIALPKIGGKCRKEAKPDKGAAVDFNYNFNLLCDDSDNEKNDDNSDNENGDSDSTDGASSDTMSSGDGGGIGGLFGNVMNAINSGGQFPMGGAINAISGNDGLLGGISGSGGMKGDMKGSGSASGSGEGTVTGALNGVSSGVFGKIMIAINKILSPFFNLLPQVSSGAITPQLIHTISSGILGSPGGDTSSGTMTGSGGDMDDDMTDEDAESDDDSTDEDAESDDDSTDEDAESDDDSTNEDAEPESSDDESDGTMDDSMSGGPSASFNFGDGGASFDASA